VWLNIVVCFGDKRNIFLQDVFKKLWELESILGNTVDFQNREYSEKCMPLTVQDCYSQIETGSENDACNTQLMKKSITFFPFQAFSNRVYQQQHLLCGKSDTSSSVLRPRIAGKVLMLGRRLPTH
jgi:hypothetical protein